MAKAFQASKELLTSDSLFVHYDHAPVIKMSSPSKLTLEEFLAVRTPWFFETFPEQKILRMAGIGNKINLCVY